MLRRRADVLGIVLCSAAIAAMLASASSGRPLRVVDSAEAATPTDAVTPIEHVVVIFQENHSFDDLLGWFCVADRLRCHGSTTGVLHTGARIPLRIAPDIVPAVSHATASQTTAINGGRMNGFDRIPGCLAPRYRCYIQYRAGEVPNLRKLAESYVISDRTFSEDPVPSWGGHMELIAGQLDGFAGDNPISSVAGVAAPGWGCDSNKDTRWKDPADPSSSYVMVPSCIPRPDGVGPYRSSPAQYVPTILDRLAAAGLSWKLYADTAPSETGYPWSICPTFASCLFDPNNGDQPDPSWVDRGNFATDAAAGTLPAYSVILPNFSLSQHNNVSMLEGDNYIGALVNDLMTGPAAQWQSTVIFITYDDCGCFYDHVTPPSGLGVRVPMVIVSPLAKASFVDDGQASYNSMLAFVEHNWGLAPLTQGDASAYDYCNSFVFAMPSCLSSPSAAARAAPTRVQLQISHVPETSLRWMKAHPRNPNDPT